MAINPVAFTERVVRSFLRYQLTTYSFADEGLHDQMKRLLSLEETRNSPLLKGPFVSLSRPFREGAAIDDLIREGILHPLMRHRIPDNIVRLFGHQEDAIRTVRSGKTTLISTGTGSGKTECFLYPIISKCLELKDSGASSGISAVIVYPMNALAEDQLLRLRSLLAGTGIPFGMYVGKTPENESDVAGVRLSAGASRADYEARLTKARLDKRGETVFPPEEVCSREVMRTGGRQPRILLTNVKQLELLLTRQKDVELFADARLDFLVFDEAHSFTGALGGETACLIRRLRTFCGREAGDTVCIGTSATIIDKRDPKAAIGFASRFFGVPQQEIAAIGENYEREVWDENRHVPIMPSRNPEDLLNSCVKAVEDPTGDQVRTLYRDLAGVDLPAGDWLPSLHAALSRNDIVFRLNEALVTPRSLHDLPFLIEENVGRPVTEAEILCWLTLSAAARKEGRPLLRPVLHGFLRGISGAVVSFPQESEGPWLWLSADDEIEDSGEGQNKHAHFPVSSCTTCGQHYFSTFLKDFDFAGKKPGGGEAAGESSYWEPLEESQGGKRVVLLDRIVGGREDEDLDESEKVSPLHFCRFCGAAHSDEESRCFHCGAPARMVILYAVKQKSENAGFLTTCISCGSHGRQTSGRYREPARQVRATTVADVHVLAQDMVQHSERPRLLVFCDNRQDAAFQAGWMKDHARRFRIRSLMVEGLKSAAMSVGDLTLFLDEILDKDESLSRSLIPEVWQVVRKEGEGGRHQQERRKFLRIQVLREITLGSRQPIGLEPWGRMKVEYEGLDASLTWVREKAKGLGIPAEDLRDGLAGILDWLRRRRALYDPELGIFSKYWQDGDLEIQQGYLTQEGLPRATKLKRETEQEKKYVLQWLGKRGDTAIRQILRKWGIRPEDIETQAEEIFRFLEKNGYLAPVRLMGSKGRALPGVSGVYQVNADKLKLQASHGLWRCRKCRRRSTRRMPLMACPAWRCDGKLDFVREDPDDYNLQVIDQNYRMLRPEEHTAMVPHEDRERLENLFKSDSDAVNAFVCTPTLELGVDIGQLDAVLMRNVPPLPANYWQRAGRAGRRHRMAVDLTYCRPVSHDRAYFAEPLKLLEGKIDPPAFNLRNELMVAKHARAAVITRLHQYTRDDARPETERTEINKALERCLPNRVSVYLFENGAIREKSFDFSPIHSVIQVYSDELVYYVSRAFRQGWPDQDSEVVRPDVIKAHVDGFARELEAVVSRLRRRLLWAMSEINRLNAIRKREGALGAEEESIFKRCDAMVKRLKGVAKKARRQAEGYDDIYTFGVLSAEGFLPGYGLEVGSVLGTAQIPYWSRTGEMEFSLPRPPSVALREYVPGNLIYANGHRFVARRFHRDIDEDRVEIPNFELSLERQAIKQVGNGGVPGALGNLMLPTIAVCDVDLIHYSHISDDEEVRFQMGVAVYGIERGRHKGGQSFHWGGQTFQHRRGVHLRLVNVGASSALERFKRLGFPVCLVCGQSVSPLSSQKQLEHFYESHEDRCGKKTGNVGFYSDVVADAVSLPGCPDQMTGYSVLEALRFGAAHVLDMHLEDLQILIIGHVDRDSVDGYLWDPMPGGSGLFDQICARFSEIREAALAVVKDCPSACATSCIDCLQTFHNGYYHKHLSRKVAQDRLEEWGDKLVVSHGIPAMQPTLQRREAARPVNEVERLLQHLLEEAGFPEGVRGHQIRLDRSIGTTTPDVFFRAQHHEENEGICLYLDGLSKHLHGNPETAERDHLIRSWLRNNGYEVIEIPASDLTDAGAMTRHFRKLAGYLGAGELREKLKHEESWFDKAVKKVTSGIKAFVLDIVHPKPEEQYRDCVPLMSLEAAAGYFGVSQEVPQEDLDWVRVKGHRLRKGMFVAKIVGKSMEPRIPDGSFGLFRAPVEGTRQGKIVLVQLHDVTDPETGGRYTVKRYQSEKVATGEEGWRHVKITLKPINPDFEPIIIAADEEEKLRVIAEFLDVIGG